MALTASQMGLCLQSYWYMWLTNSLSGFLFLGVDIGIAAFFLMKFKKNNPSHAYQRPPTSQSRPITPRDIETIDTTIRDTPSRKSSGRVISAKSNVSSLIDESDDFAFATRDAINAVRRQYGVPQVELDQVLNDIAQDWANQMAESGKLEHRPLEFRNFGRQSLGENFLPLFQSELTAVKMVRRWMKEGRKYKFGFDGTRETANFTQLVWEASREIGVGRARSADGNWWYGVVVFDPPGNIPNQYSANVKFPTV